MKKYPKTLLEMVIGIFVAILLVVFLATGNYSGTTIIGVLLLLFAVLIMMLLILKKNVLIYTILMLFGILLLVFGLATVFDMNNQLAFVVGVYGPISPSPPYVSLIGVLFLAIAEIIRRKTHITKAQIFGTNKSQAKPSSVK